MKVLLTGSTGMLGSRIAKKLALKGIAFRAMVLGNERAFFPRGAKVEIISADITIPSSLQRALAGIDAIIHCAALVDGNDSKAFFKVNAEGTKNLVSAAEKAGVKRLVHISTADVEFGEGAYSLSKLEAEKAVETSKIGWTILRPTAICDEKKSKIAKLVALVKAMPIIPMVGSGNNLLQPVWIEDVADAVLKAFFSKKSIGKTYSLASEEPVSYRGIIDLAAKKLGKKVIKVPVPAALLLFAACLLGAFSKKPFLNADQLRLLGKDKLADISLAKKELGFTPKKIDCCIGIILGGKN